MSAIHLYLVYTIPLVLIREPIIRCTLRFGKQIVTNNDANSDNNNNKNKNNNNNNQYTNMREIINLGWLGLPYIVVLSVFVALCFRSDWISSASANASSDYGRAVFLFSLSAVIEGLSLQLYVVAHKILLVKLRVTAESTAVFVRCLTTYYCVFHQTLGLLSFAYGQLAYSITFSAVYYLFFCGSLLCKTRNNNHHQPQQPQQIPFQCFRDLFPKRTSSHVWTDKHLIGDLSHFTILAFFKMLLTEGEKFILVPYLLV